MWKEKDKEMKANTQVIFIDERMLMYTNKLMNACNKSV